MATPTSPTPVKKGRQSPPVPADFSVLTVEDQMRLRKEAEATVQAERKKAAEAAFLDRLLDEERRNTGVEEELVQVTLNLAEFCDRITLDGRIYFQGRTYTVPVSVFDTIRDIAFRTWQHQDEIDGKSRFKPKPQNIRVTPHGVINTTQNMMRV